jgi:anti-anti-sigma factor
MSTVARRSAARMTVYREGFAGGWSILHLQGSLRWPVSPDLRQRVEALLRRGQRTVLLDVAGVAAIDAAGVGELVRLCRILCAVDGVLQVSGATSRVCTMLDLAGLGDLFNLDCVGRAVPSAAGVYAG